MYSCNVTLPLPHQRLDSFLHPLESRWPRPVTALSYKIWWEGSGTASGLALDWSGRFHIQPLRGQSSREKCRFPEITTSTWRSLHGGACSAVRREKGAGEQAPGQRAQTWEAGLERCRSLPSFFVPSAAPQLPSWCMSQGQPAWQSPFWICDLQHCE